MFHNFEGKIFNIFVCTFTYPRFLLLKSISCTNTCIVVSIKSACDFFFFFNYTQLSNWRFISGSCFSQVLRLCNYLYIRAISYICKCSLQNVEKVIKDYHSLLTKTMLSNIFGLIFITLLPQVNIYMLEPVSSSATEGGAATFSR